MGRAQPEEALTFDGVLVRRAHASVIETSVLLFREMYPYPSSCRWGSSIARRVVG
jgi:hypothetical protein